MLYYIMNTAKRKLFERNMDRIITNEETRDLQLKMLGFIDNLCSNNNLRYYLSYGSLIGAIRHGGFIPWDDDIDLVMPKEDYEKLLRLFEKEKIIDCYKLLDIRIESKYYLPYGKLVDIRTIIKENYQENFQIGVGIDIFPLYNVGNCYKRAKIKYYTVQFFRNLADIKLMRVDKKRRLLKTFVLMMGKALLCSISTQLLIRTTIGLAERLSNKGDGDLLCNLLGGVYGIREIHQGEWYSAGNRAKFDSLYVMIPSCYDAILTKIYGDYMALPPKEKQVSHHEYTAYWKK